MTILTVEGLKKTYTTRLGGESVQALKNVNFSVENGEYVAIMGESGSGKTTLLNILAALDKPSSGRVTLDGMAISEVKEKELAAFRRKHLGFVFQEFNLLDTMNVADNILLPLVLGGEKERELDRRLAPIAESLGIEEILKKYPYEISGGQKQRVLLARSLCATEKMLLLDEPVSGLDPVATQEMYDLIERINKEEGVTVLMISHDVEAALRYATHVLYLGKTVFFGTKDEYEKEQTK